MKNYKLIPKITLLVLLALGIVASIMFYVGGSAGQMEVAGDFLNIPKFTNLFLFWNYTLLSLVVLVTLAVVIWRFAENCKNDKKKAIASASVVLGFILLACLCWFLGSPEKLDIIGYEGTDNAGNWARLSDAMIYMVYILIAATLCTMVWGIIHTKRLK